MAQPEENHDGRTTRFAQIFARLIDLPGYVWDTEIEPFHSVRTAKRYMQTPAPS
jgi:hypothetical protein